MRNELKAILVVLIGAFLVFGGTTGETAAFAASPSVQPIPFKLRTAFAPTLQFAQFYVAQELYWPKLNLAGTTLAGKGPGATVQSVAAGSEQAGSSTVVEVMNGIQKGMPIKIIAVIQRRDPGGIIFMKDSGIRELKDLVGKRVGQIPTAFYSSFLRTALRQNGFDERGVRLVNVPPGGEVALLLERKIDALVAIAGGQDLRLRCKGYEATSIPFSDFGLESYGLAVFANTKWADQVGDDVVALALLGIIQGASMVKQDGEQALGILQKLNPQIQFDRFAELGTHQTYVRWSWHPESPVLNKQGFGWIDEAEMARTQKVFVESGLLEKESEVGAYYTNKYLKDPRVHQAALEMARTPWPEAPVDVKKQCGL